MKYIIKNCPLYEQYDCFNLGKCKNSSCCNGIHIDFCKDIENCLLKQIVEKCKEKIIFCKNCSKNADINIDCVECEERGEAHFAQCILNNFLEIEEVDEQLRKNKSNEY